MRDFINEMIKAVPTQWIELLLISVIASITIISVTAFIADYIAEHHFTEARVIKLESSHHACSGVKWAEDFGALTYASSDDTIAALNKFKKCGDK